MRTLLPYIVAILLLVALTPTGRGNMELFRLQVLHFSDVDGYTGEAIGNVPSFSALLSYFRQIYSNNTLILSSGDNYIPGPRYSAAADGSMIGLLGVPGPGRADIALLNALGVHASTIGNHELDRGTLSFVRSITAETHNATSAVFPGAQFPFLSANIDFTTDPNAAAIATHDGQDVAAIPGRLAGSAFVRVGGHKVGLVGGATPDFVRITRLGTLSMMPRNFDADDADSLNALAAQLQLAVDALTSTGINKVILLTHMQEFRIDQELARRLRDVDIIIAGGSNTILADRNDRLRPGDTAEGTYPLVFSSATGEPVLVVNTDGDYRYLGRLVVDFDARGVVVNADSMDERQNGAYATDVIQQTDASPIPEIAALARGLTSALEAGAARMVVGYSDVVLEGSRNKVRKEETNLGNLAADANLAVARAVDDTVRVALTVGGGIRATVGPGAISQIDLESALPFNSGLVLVTVTARELVTILEHAVAATAAQAAPGRFPQVSGLRLQFDPNQPGVGWLDVESCRGNPEFGTVSRIQHLSVVDGANEMTADAVVSNGVIQGDPERTFRLVTRDFLAGGGDAYPYPCLASPEFVDLSDLALEAGSADFAPAGTEQDALAEYMLKNFVTAPFGIAETVGALDGRIINLENRVQR